MAIEIIDGRIVSLVVKRSHAKVTLYKAMIFDVNDGKQRTLENVAIAPAVNKAIYCGAQGRFYTYKAIDHGGLMAVRRDDGIAAFEMPGGNERILLIAAIAGLGLLIVLLASGSNFKFLALLFALASFFGNRWYRLMRTEGKMRFDADSASPNGDSS